MFAGGKVDLISVFVIMTRARLMLRESGGALLNRLFVEVFVCKKELWVN